MTSLSPADARILAFEAAHPRPGGIKDEQIRAELGLTPARYYQRLNMLIDAPSARAAYPSMIARLSRVRNRRGG